MRKINEKYCIEDHGFREALSARNTADIQQILENIIYTEMISRGYQITVGKVEKKEIDFSQNGIRHMNIVRFLKSSDILSLQ